MTALPLHRVITLLAPGMRTIRFNCGTWTVPPLLDV